MTINEIFLKKEISVRAFNTCTDNEIETISELKEYFNTYGSFKRFRNCGKKTDNELVAVCLEYFDIDHQSLKTIDVYSDGNIVEFLSNFDENKLSIIDEFINSRIIDLSKRSSNALKKYLSGDITITNFTKKIFDNSYFNLNKIEDVGAKSIPEIGFFLKEIKTFILDLSDEVREIEKSFNAKKDNDVFFLIEKLNRRQRQIINNHILILTNDLSTRSHNAIIKFLDAEPNLNLLKEKVFSQVMIDVYSIKNIGENTSAEVNTYFNEIKQLIKDVFKETDDSQLDYLELEFLLKSRFKNLDVSILLKDQNSIFRLVNTIIDNFYIFNETDTHIFKKTFNIYDHSVFIKLDDIGVNLNLTRERIRQKRISLFEKLNLKFQFFKYFNHNTLLNYRIDINSSSIIIDEEAKNFINSIEKTNFSKSFITFIISTFFKNEFFITGNIEDAIILKDGNARFRHNWQNIYLIRKRFFEKFYLDKFVEDIESRLNERIDENYKFNFKSYLSRFQKENDFTIVDEISTTCEKILFEEFNLFLSINEEIVFKRNTLKTLPEYAFEALEILGKPSHISEINEQIKILKPDYENEIKNTTLKRKFGFISFSRTSTFGLKKWEIDNDNIKGGTIRSIAEEFLFKYNEPMHIGEIAEYVLKYRPESNEKSIIYNLKMEDNNRFLFFKKSLIGLKSKKYDNHELELLDEVGKIEKKTWDENYQELINFIEKNNRLPSSMSCPVDEIKINRWLNVQRSKKNRGILEEDKIDKINQVVSNYNVRVNKTTLFRNEGYEKLAQFILKEKRLPSANKTDESQLYAFFYKQRKLFEEGTLDPEEETKIIDIAKLIQNKQS